MGSIATAFIVSITFFMIPWIATSDMDSLWGMKKRVFPVHRGVFEDKVATFWFFTNTFFKVNQWVEHSLMVKICLLFTLLSISYSLYALFKKTNIQVFLMVLFNVSMGFFLFSFHVHEKTILLPMIPAILLFF